MHIKKIGRKLGCKIISPVMQDAYPVGGGADIVIDSVGNASSLSNSLRLCKAKGTVILLGYPPYINLDFTPMMAKEITVIASNIFSFENIKGKQIRTMQLALDLISSDMELFKELVTHKFPLEEYKEALNVAINKPENKAVKIAFAFD